MGSCTSQSCVKGTVLAAPCVSLPAHAEHDEKPTVLFCKWRSKPANVDDPAPLEKLSGHHCPGRLPALGWNQVTDFCCCLAGRDIGGREGRRGRRNVGGEATKEPVKDVATTGWSPRSWACRQDWPTAGQLLPAESRDRGRHTRLSMEATSPRWDFLSAKKRMSITLQLSVKQATFSRQDSEGAPQPRGQGGRGQGPGWAHRGWGASDPEPSGTRTSAGSRLSSLAPCPPRPPAWAHVLSRLSRP